MMERTESLAGMRAIIAGGTAGLGLAISRTIGRAGATLAVCGRDEDRCRRASASLTVEGSAVSRCDAVDVTAPGFEDWLEATATSFGGVDLFVANAGAGGPGHDWVSTLESTLLYVVRSCETLGAWLEEAQGRVVVIGSIARTMADIGPANAAYGASKAALAHFVAERARSWGPSGVVINAVDPGPVLVPGGWWDTDPLLHPERHQLRVGLEQRAALGRLVTPSEVADAVLFLARASGITGTTLRVDAGLLPTI